MFEAAARYGNFSSAAKEFNVTQPAISRMVTRLESHFGVKLFQRKTTGVELTPEGRILAKAVEDGFGRIEDAICELQMLRQEVDTVTISVTSAFAIHWLMPNLRKFSTDLPGVCLHLEIIHGEPFGPLGMADLGIRENAVATDDTNVWPIVDEWVFPVSSPGYLASQGALNTPGSSERHVLANLSTPMRISWETYFNAAWGCRSEGETMSFSDYALIIQGAIKGQAIALGWWHVVANEVRTGGLVPLDHKILRTGLQMHVVARQGTAMRPCVDKVRQWLLAEFAELEIIRKSLNLETINLKMANK